MVLDHGGAIIVGIFLCASRSARAVVLAENKVVCTVMVCRWRDVDMQARHRPGAKTTS